MSADEMFQELGYRKLVGDIKVVYINTRHNKEILFSLLLKRINFSGQCRFIDMQELQAIYTKCKEMGWIQ